MIEFRFALPAALLLLLLPPVIGLSGVGSRLRSLPPVMRYSDIRLMDGLPCGWRVRFRHVPDGLRLVAWVLLVVALARPQSGRAQEILRGQGIDIVLALDISGSMAALDFGQQNRLEVAKSVIAAFIDKREFDHIGLVVFAHDAFQQAPLTLDYDVLRELLREVRLVTTIAGLEDGTAIGLGLASAANMLRNSTAASKVIILLTDGDNNAGLDPLTAARAAAALGIRVYAIGMSSGGARIPVPAANNGVEFIPNDLNEGLLQGVASAANGLYLRAQSRQGLQQIYDRINALERSEVTRQVFVRWQDQAFGWLFAAFGVLVVERVLRHTAFQTVP